MSAMNFGFDAAETVREARRRGLIQATIANVRLGNQPVVVRNLSSRGLGATARGSVPRAGETLTVLLPGNVCAEGRVCWVNGTSFGLELEAELPLEEITGGIRDAIQQAQPRVKWEVQRRHRVDAPRLNGCFRRI